MAHALTAGTPVHFADIHGEFTGRIVGPITDIENGRRMFAIEVDHTLRGIVHIVGADTIQALMPEFLSPLSVDQSDKNG